LTPALGLCYTIPARGLNRLVKEFFMRNFRLVFCLFLLLPAYATTAGTTTLEIFSPRDDRRYLDNEAIFFQGQTTDASFEDAGSQIVWRVIHRFTKEEVQRQGLEFTLQLEPGIYDIEASVLGSDGQTLASAELPFSVFHRPDIELSVSKRKISGQWLWTRYETQIEWTGAAGPVDIFQQKACAGGFTGTKPCQGLMQLTSGASSGTIRVPYQKDDSFRICEAGSHPSDEDAEWKCSFDGMVE